MATVDEKMTAIADKIRSKTGETELLSLDGMADGVEDVFEAGKKAEYDAFWDAYQEGGNRTNYAQAFYNKGWNDVTFHPKYPIVLEDNAYAAFAYSTFTEIRQPVDISRATYTEILFGSAQVRHIEELIVSENTAFDGTTFLYCYWLEDITIAGVIGKSLSLSYSEMLTNDSVQSIIEHLKDFTGATAQTITFHATVGGKLTQAQKDAISAKNWTLVY